MFKLHQTPGAAAQVSADGQECTLTVGGIFLGRHDSGAIMGALRTLIALDAKLSRAAQVVLWPALREMSPTTPMTFGLGSVLADIITSGDDSARWVGDAPVTGRQVYAYLLEVWDDGRGKWQPLGRAQALVWPCRADVLDEADALRTAGARVRVVPLVAGLPGQLGSVAVAAAAC